MRKFWFVMSLALQLGYMIAIPVSFLAFGGAFLDRHLGTSPLFILIGIVIALVISSLWVGRLIKRIEHNG